MDQLCHAWKALEQEMQHIARAFVGNGSAQQKQSDRLSLLLANPPGVWRRLCLLIMVFAVTGCASGLKPTPEVLREQAPFIRDGETTRFELQDRYGSPANRYEGGRVITYVMRRDNNGGLNVLTSERMPKTTPEADRYPGVYNLILVFREDGVLERHALLQLR